jgi:hypothetical protein
MRVEDDLRAALSSLERHAPDPATVLRAARGRAAGRRGSSLPRWIVALAAAASVVAVVAGSLLTTGALSAGKAHPGKARRPDSPAARPRPATLDGLPAYFLALGYRPAGARPGRGHWTGQLEPQAADIVVTATGEVAAAGTLPAGLTRVAASHDGTFYAAVTSGQTTKFYQIRLPASGTVASVTRLPIPALPAAGGPAGQVDSITASPDGSHLAISTDVQHGDTGDVQNLIVASVATGTERRWTTPPQDSGGSMGPISWLADSRTLAVNWLGFTAATPSSLRLLDTAAPGTDLLSGRAVLPLNTSQLSDFSVSPDGRVLIGIADHPKSAPVVQGRTAVQGSVIGFSARTGRARLLYHPPTVRDKWTGMTLNSNCLDPLWISNSGQQVLLMCIRPRPEGPQRILSVPHILLLDHRRVIQLPWLTGIAQAITAFGG